MFVFKAAVVGAGTMGGQIAQTIAAAGIPVVLKDVKQDFVDAGLTEARNVTQGQVDRLVKKGLLQRKRTRRDARMYAVRLTQKGQAALNAVKPAAARVDQRLLSVLAANERSGFIGALGEIVRAMNQQAARR